MREEERSDASDGRAGARVKTIVVGGECSCGRNVYVVMVGKVE